MCYFSHNQAFLKGVWIPLDKTQRGKLTQALVESRNERLKSGTCVVANVLSDLFEKHSTLIEEIQETVIHDSLARTVSGFLRRSFALADKNKDQRDFFEGFEEGYELVPETIYLNGSWIVLRKASVDQYGDYLLVQADSSKGVAQKSKIGKERLAQMRKLFKEAKQRVGRDRSVSMEDALSRPVIKRAAYASKSRRSTVARKAALARHRKDH